MNSGTFHKVCDIGPPPTETHYEDFTCPIGFHFPGGSANSTLHNSNSAHISCGFVYTPALNNTSVDLTMTCGTAYVGSSDCYATLTCLAN